MGVSPVATWQLLRLGPVDQCVGRSTGRRGRERLAPDDRALGTVAATGASDLILAGLRGRLARTQTTGALAHIATSFQFQATPGWRKNRLLAAVTELGNTSPQKKAALGRPWRFQLRQQPILTFVQLQAPGDPRGFWHLHCRPKRKKRL